MISIAYSPCPNDIFIFDAWTQGRVKTSLLSKTDLADVETLNQRAIQKEYDVCKVSFAVLPKLLDDYILLPVGAALGFGCGPKIISLNSFDLSQLKDKKIAVPGQETTANFLLDLLCPPPFSKDFCFYNEITKKIKSHQVDAGLIIHETRFTFHELGFQEIVDLGTLWEKRYNFPLPLGGIVAKRSLGSKMLKEVVETLKNSVLHAEQFPHNLESNILKFSQEHSACVTKKHISTYVTPETFNLSSLGVQAIEFFLAEYTKLYKIPIKREWLFQP